ncbi:hypothetical protein K501DRAFT_192026 [Backusella circina FSU 941]|nr:hypothetical protein K501DRAFT_192026 [Backusella circina FSU 941]
MSIHPLLTYIRSLKIDILLMQETHAHSPDIIEQLETRLKPYSSTWSSRCGILSFNPNVNLVYPFVKNDERVILVKAVHSTNGFHPFYVLNLYAPSCCI